MNKLIKKLQTAINLKFGERLLVNQTQFYSEDQKRPITIISIRKAIIDEDDPKRKMKSVELYKSCSDTQILLFLRDYWFTLNGWEIPDDGKRGNEDSEHE